MIVDYRLWCWFGWKKRYFTCGWTSPTAGLLRCLLQ